jgi:hypothetical protein
MALTRDFKERIRTMAQEDPEFREALLREAIETMISGDVATGKAVLRDYINATIGFPALEQAVRIPATSLMRMFGPKGNPSAENLFTILAHLQHRQGVNFELHARKFPKKGRRPKRQSLTPRRSHLGSLDQPPAI